MIIIFAGHSSVSKIDSVKERVKEEIRKNAADSEFVTCYLGGYGDFDKLCACACREMKKERRGVEVVYVTPYFSLAEQKKIKEQQELGLYDSSIYPPIERVPPRLAILKRNEWMIANADFVIVYVNHGYGGAYKSLSVARRNKKRIINICDLV